MEMLAKLERKILEWVKGVPHLPESARKWLGNNIWWIAVIGAVISGIGVLSLIVSLFTVIATFGSPIVSYYAAPSFLGWVIVTTAVSLFFTAVSGLLLAFAIMPLKEKQKKGWVLLFAVWLVGILSALVSAILTLNVLTIIGSVIFSAVWVAITGYLLFEIHGQFAHTEKSKGLKDKKVS